jgi:UDP-N-acetylmuramoyl-tripeptide--D-alanyl-D-alanine ligase
LSLNRREKLKNTIELAKNLSSKNYLVLNYDDETVREIDDLTNLHTFTFGFSERANFFASDLKFNHGINFKVNYKGSVVPFWLEETFGKEQIYSVLAAVAVGTIFGKNLIEISQAMKNYKPLPGRMRLIDGINNSKILDDSESATIFSMIEAIEILGKIPSFKRKIAVLGDVIGVGKYTIEAHESVGEKVAKNCDLLFTVGPRAKFIAKGALEKGMDDFKIFSFDKVEDVIFKLKETIKSGDIVLVDGSKEMKMSEIVDQIRKIW